jgi:hypothetical protein
VDDLRESWAQAESHLEAVLAETDLPASRRWIEELLDHNELGLAFEVIACGLADTTAELTNETRAHLAEAAREMGPRRKPTMASPF